MATADKTGEAALRFARLCLLQPESTLAEDRGSVEVKPDGYNAGPEAFEDRTSLEYDDVGDVIRIVTYWCRLNTVKLDISYFDEVYTCTLTEGSPVYQIVTSDDSSNLCFCLLDSCAFLASKMKQVNPPHASMLMSDFIDATSPHD